MSKNKLEYLKLASCWIGLKYYAQFCDGTDEWDDMSLLEFMNHLEEFTDEVLRKEIEEYHRYRE